MMDARKSMASRRSTKSFQRCSNKSKVRDTSTPSSCLIPLPNLLLPHLHLSTLGPQNLRALVFQNTSYPRHDLTLKFASNELKCVGERARALGMQLTSRAGLGRKFEAKKARTRWREEVGEAGKGMRHAREHVDAKLPAA